MTILAIFHSPAPKRYEIWATLAQRLQSRSHLTLSSFFYTNVLGPYKCIGKQTWPRRKKVNGQTSMYDHHFSNFSWPPVPDCLCKDSVPRHPLFWRRRFLKVYTIYGHGGHLGKWTTFILAIFHSPVPRRLQMKFEQYWPRGYRGEVVWNSQHFSHTNVLCPYECIRKQIWPHRKKGQTSCSAIILATLVDLPFPMICAMIQPQGILGSWEEGF